MGISFFSVLLTSPALASDYYYYEYENHSIPLCASTADTDVAETMGMSLKSFTTTDSYRGLFCGANIFTVSSSKGSYALESIIESIGKIHYIIDYYYENNTVFIKTKDRRQIFYHEIIVADSDHIVNFLTTAEYPSIAQEALSYMMINFR